MLISQDLCLKCPWASFVSDFILSHFQLSFFSPFFMLNNFTFKINNCCLPHSNTCCFHQRLQQNSGSTDVEIATHSPAESTYWLLLEKWHLTQQGTAADFPKSEDILENAKFYSPSSGTAKDKIAHSFFTPLHIFQ